MSVVGRTACAPSHTARSLRFARQKLTLVRPTGPSHPLVGPWEPPTKQGVPVLLRRGSKHGLPTSQGGGASITVAHSAASILHGDRPAIASWRSAESSRRRSTRWRPSFTRYSSSSSVVANLPSVATCISVREEVNARQDDSPRRVPLVATKIIGDVVPRTRCAASTAGVNHTICVPWVRTGGDDTLVWHTRSELLTLSPADGVAALDCGRRGRRVRWSWGAGLRTSRSGP